MGDVSDIGDLLVKAQKDIQRKGVWRTIAIAALSMVSSVATSAYVVGRRMERLDAALDAIAKLEAHDEVHTSKEFEAYTVGIAARACCDKEQARMDAHLNQRTVP